MASTGPGQRASTTGERENLVKNPNSCRVTRRRKREDKKDFIGRKGTFSRRAHREGPDRKSTIQGNSMLT